MEYEDFAYSGKIDRMMGFDRGAYQRHQRRLSYEPIEHSQYAGPPLKLAGGPTLGDLKSQLVKRAAWVVLQICAVAAFFH